MVAQESEAVFEDGISRPRKLPAIPLIEGRSVRLMGEGAAARDDVLALAEQVYAGLSEEEIAAIERVALDRGAFFGEPAR